jgi:hypothetical protein
MDIKYETMSRAESRSFILLDQTSDTETASFFQDSVFISLPSLSSKQLLTECIYLSLHSLPSSTRSTLLLALWALLMSGTSAWYGQMAIMAARVIRVHLPYQMKKTARVRTVR